MLGGLNFTTRDFARFGQMILQGGEYNGQQLVSAEWINDAVAPTAPTAPGDYGYGYQWWIPTEAHEGEFLARGVYGQHIYFDRERDLVIVVTSADRKFRDPGVTDSNMEMFRKIAESL